VNNLKENIKYLWDKETLTATCILYKDNGQIFTGTATCHPDDFDMCNEKTGYEIATRRATINSLKQYLNELKAGYQALH